MKSRNKFFPLVFCFFISLITLPLTTICQVNVDEIMINAENGDPNAQYKLGTYYFNGNTKLPKSEEKSTFWYKKAAQQGHINAHLCLAAKYSGFLDAEKDVTKQIYWYKKAAMLGSAKAFYELGLLSYYGEGMPVDLLKSSDYFKKAISNGSSILKDNKTSLYDRRPMRNKIIILDLADSFYFGLNETKINKHLAFFWYEKCAKDLEMASAQCNLGVLYENGEGILKNLKKAFFWFSKAANQGYTDAQYTLGNYYANGMGNLKNNIKAIYWWEKAANKNNPKAQFNLAVTYCYGEGVTKDMAKAAYWAQKAYNNGSDEVKKLWEQEELWKYLEE